MIEHVDADRLRDLTLELVEIESPTGDTAVVARRFAQRLEEIGMEVEVLDEVFPATPIVIGRLRGGEPGPSVVLNGHLDTVPIPHEPARIENGSVYGRGSADMKGALACAAEAARVLEASGPFPGELVIIAIGMHEAPGGRGEDLTWLLREHGFRSDFAVVCELSGDTFLAAHMGQATVEITIARPGLVTHELKTPSGDAASDHGGRPRDRRDRRAQRRAGRDRASVGRGRDVLPRRGAQRRLLQPLPERVPPRSAPAAGRPATRSRRSRPSSSRCSSRSRPRPAARSSSTSGSSAAPTRSIPSTSSRGLCGPATRTSPARELPLTGIKVVADGAVFQGEAAIPTVYHGPAGTGAHGDVEFIPIAELVRATQVYLAMLQHLWAA